MEWTVTEEQQQSWKIRCQQQLELVLLVGYGTLVAVLHGNTATTAAIPLLAPDPPKTAAAWTSTASVTSHWSQPLSHLSFIFRMNQLFFFYLHAPMFHCRNFSLDVTQEKMTHDSFSFSVLRECSADSFFFFFFLRHTDFDAELQRQNLHSVSLVLNQTYS